MTARGPVRFTLVLLSIPHITGMALGFGPGPAAARIFAGYVARKAAGHADFKVLVWYSRKDAIGTFKYQIYDLRKGEYTPAVDAWLRDLATKYPSYTAFVRSVDLARVTGATEKLKVGSVIQRELTVAAAMSGVMFGGPFDLGQSIKMPGQNLGPGRSAQPGPFSPDRSVLNANPPSFPVPMPYPRPHP
jgi:hypothetical protein